jgi:hypothetical protein
MSNKVYCTIEYIDKDGESVIEHIVLTEEEKIILINKFIDAGIIACIYQHGQNISPAVLLDNEQSPRLESTINSKFK